VILGFVFVILMGVSSCDARVFVRSQVSFLWSAGHGYGFLGVVFRVGSVHVIVLVRGVCLLGARCTRRDSLLFLR